MSTKNIIKKWWRYLCYAPDDPRNLAGGHIKIVVIGGGTGLSTLLRGLKKYSSGISAIVAVTDDGASSGVLRKEYDMLPPGDIRQCISALAYDEELISKLMEFRFEKSNNTFSGHTLGNIWLTALTKYFGSFEAALEATTELFKSAGSVLPATLGSVQLCAEYKDGSRICGESKIPQPGKEIRKVYLSKNRVKGYARALRAISDADLIVFGPGSLYTSVIPNLLIQDIRDALRLNVHSVNVYICNCSTERGETENYLVKDHIDAIYTHCGGKVFDYCIVNNKILKLSNDASMLGNINNITTKEKRVLGCRVVQADVVSRSNPLYHDSERLAKALIDLYNESKN